MYVSDLDGTLLHNDATLSEFSRTALTRLLTEDIPFTVASARNVVSMRTALGDLPLKLPVIGFNGAFISDYTTGQHHVVNSMNQAIVDAVYELFREYHCDPFITTFHGGADHMYYARIVNAGMSWYRDERVRAGDLHLRPSIDIRSCLKKQVVSFNIIDLKEKLDRVIDAVRSTFHDEVALFYHENRYSPGWHWLQVYDKRATKDQAIRVMAESLGIGIDQVTVFGDEVNDVKLSRWAPDRWQSATRCPR